MNESGCELEENWQSCCTWCSQQLSLDLIICAKTLPTYLFGVSCNQRLMVPSSYKSELILGGNTGLGQGQCMRRAYSEDWFSEIKQDWTP